MFTVSFPSHDIHNLKHAEKRQVTSPLFTEQSNTTTSIFGGSQTIVDNLCEAKFKSVKSFTFKILIDIQDQYFASQIKQFTFMRIGRDLRSTCVEEV